MIAARKKWRPSIAMVVAVVCMSLISIPLIALLAVRLTSNQFVRETEQSLIHQGAIYAEVFASTFAALPGPQVGKPLTPEQKDHWTAGLHPIRAELNVHRDPVAQTRPDGVFVSNPPDSRYIAVADVLTPIARQSRQTTLSGVIILDHTGRALNVTGAPSHAALPEVQTALSGNVGAMLRARADDYDPHPLSSLSRDTGFRVFVTYPVIVNDHVVGAIYLSRTPLNLGKFLFQERYALLTMLAFTVLGATLIGWLLLRLISRPIYALRTASQDVATGQNPKSPSPMRYGLRELADLGNSLSIMAGTLTRRSQEISTYTDHVTHELKSPVTSIMGAAELLQSDTLAPPDRARLTSNIEAEAVRMNKMLGQLRDMTRLKLDTAGMPACLHEMLPHLDGLDVQLSAGSNTRIPLSIEHGRMILSHMFQNARAHGANVVRVAYDNNALRITDNGTGVAVNDLTRIMDPFFTTRRETGGTGMGLAIVQAVLDGYGASIVCLPSTDGAVFELRFPPDP